METTQPEADTSTDDKAPGEWINHGALEGDQKRQVSQVLELAKARFRNLLKQTFDEPDAKAAGRKKKKETKQQAAAAAVDAFADVAGLTLEQLAMMQIACITQGVVDCSTRAALEPRPEDEADDAGGYAGRASLPLDARRSHRHAELFDVTHLAHASARLMDTVARIKGERGARHAFTYEHLHRHVSAAAAPSADAPETVNETPEQRAAGIADIVFNGIRIVSEPDEVPSPSQATA